MTADEENVLKSLNPIYNIEDLQRLESMELNNFSPAFGLTSRVLATGQPFYTEDLAQQPEYLKNTDSLTPVGTNHADYTYCQPHHRATQRRQGQL